MSTYKRFKKFHDFIEREKIEKLIYNDLHKHVLSHVSYV